MKHMTQFLISKQLNAQTKMKYFSYLSVLAVKNSLYFVVVKKMKYSIYSSKENDRKQFHCLLEKYTTQKSKLKQCVQKGTEITIQRMKNYILNMCVHNIKVRHKLTTA